MKYKKETINYTIDKMDKDVTNILVYVDVSDIRTEHLRRYALSGESAQEVSLKLYDTSEYYWVLYMLNDVVNPHEDWYMSPTQLRRYADYKYTKPDAPHSFYYLSTREYLSHKQSKDMQYLYEQGMKLPADVTFKSFFEYETELNEDKKVITTVKVGKLLEFINIYNDRLKYL